jgi:hypothetical protein
VAADTTTEGVENLTVALTAPASGATLGAASSVSVVTAIADTSISPVKTITYSATTFAEATANDGSIADSVTLTLANDTYTGTNGQVLAGAVVTNAPAGLTPVVTKTSPTVATVTFTGNATSHANANDISNLTITLDNTAFTGGSAASVTNATKIDVGVDFADPAPIKAITYSATTFAEAPANDGSIAGSVTLTLANDTYTGTNGQVLAGAVVTNAPAGLTPVVTKTSPTVATVTFTGNATAHANTNDISNLTITLDNTAFTGGSAASVTNATKSNLGIDFADPATPSDTTAPTMTSAVVSKDGLTIVITYSEPLTGTPEKADYALTGLGSVTISSADLGTGADANKVTLNLSGAISSSVYLSDLIYTASIGTANSIKDTATPANNAATQTLATVSNGAPEMRSAAVSADGLKLVITYSEPLTGTPEKEDYALTGLGSVTISSAELGTEANANKVTLNLSAAITSGVTLSNLIYTATASTANSIKDAATPAQNALTQTLPTIINGPEITTPISGTGTFSATNGVDTFNISAGNYTATINGGLAINDKLLFPVGTQIGFTNAPLEGADPLTAGKDGLLTLTGTFNGQEFIIKLTGVSSLLDEPVFDTDSFISAFGQGSLVF